MKLIDFIPHFAKMNVYRDKDNEVIYFSEFEDTEYIVLPTEIIEKTQYHELVNVFKFMRVSFIYGTVFAEKWNWK